MKKRGADTLSGAMFTKHFWNVIVFHCFFSFFFLCAKHGRFILRTHRQYDKWVTIWFIDVNWLIFSSLSNSLCNRQTHHIRSSWISWSIIYGSFKSIAVDRAIVHAPCRTNCIDGKTYDILSCIQWKYFSGKCYANWLSLAPFYQKNAFYIFTVDQFPFISFFFLNRRLKSFVIQILRL